MAEGPDDDRPSHPESYVQTDNEILKHEADRLRTRSEDRKKRHEAVKTVGLVLCGAVFAGTAPPWWMTWTADKLKKLLLWWLN